MEFLSGWPLGLLSGHACSRIGMIFPLLLYSMNLIIAVAADEEVASPCHLEKKVTKLRIPIFGIARQQMSHIKKHMT